MTEEQGLGLGAGWSAELSENKSRLTARGGGMDFTDAGWDWTKRGKPQAEGYYVYRMHLGPRGGGGKEVRVECTVDVLAKACATAGLKPADPSEWSLRTVWGRVRSSNYFRVLGKLTKASFTSLSSHISCSQSGPAVLVTWDRAPLHLMGKDMSIPGSYRVLGALMVEHVAAPERYAEQATRALQKRIHERAIVAEVAVRYRSWKLNEKKLFFVEGNVSEMARNYLIETLGKEQLFGLNSRGEQVVEGGGISMVKSLGQAVEGRTTVGGKRVGFEEYGRFVSFPVEKKDYQTPTVFRTHVEEILKRGGHVIEEAPSWPRRDGFMMRLRFQTMTKAVAAKTYLDEHGGGIFGQHVTWQEELSAFRRNYDRDLSATEIQRLPTEAREAFRPAAQVSGGGGLGKGAESRGGGGRVQANEQGGTENVHRGHAESNGGTEQEGGGGEDGSGREHQTGGGRATQG